MPDNPDTESVKDSKSDIEKADAVTPKAYSIKSGVKHSELASVEPFDALENRNISSNVSRSSVYSVH